jgi:centromeric protein E
VSYLEIYNECIKDLLDPHTEKELAVKETKDHSVIVQGRKEVIVTSVQKVLELMTEGEEHRHYGKTMMNDLSSRSHTILTLTIESKKIATAESKKASARNATMRTRGARGGKRGEKEKTEKVRVSHLNFVDLAGSERTVQAGTSGARQKEGTHINKSLLFLGVVISRLSEKQKYIPYRDSKLTRMLQTSLGGNARTVIICNISPALSNLEPTMNTLRFGSRAIKILNHAKVNEVSGAKAMLNQYQEKIINMTNQLSHLSHKRTQSTVNAEKQVADEQVAEEKKMATSRTLFCATPPAPCCKPGQGRQCATAAP